MKPFKDTKLAAFLKEKAPSVLSAVVDVAGNYFPPVKLLSALIGGDNTLTSEQKIEAENKIAEYELTELKEHLADIANARDMYKTADHSMADSIAKRVIDWNLVIIMALVAVQVGAVYYIEGQIAAVVTGVIGTITGALINERSTVINFFFGSSKGGKDNADVMRTLAQKE